MQFIGSVGHYFAPAWRMSEAEGRWTPTAQQPAPSPRDQVGRLLHQVWLLLFALRWHHSCSLCGRVGLVQEGEESRLQRSKWQHIEHLKQGRNSWSRTFKEVEAAWILLPLSLRKSGQSSFASAESCQKRGAGYRRVCCLEEGRCLCQHSIARTCPDWESPLWHKVSSMAIRGETLPDHPLCLHSWNVSSGLDLRVEDAWTYSGVCAASSSSPCWCRD